MQRLNNRYSAVVVVVLTADSPPFVAVQFALIVAVHQQPQISISNHLASPLHYFVSASVVVPTYQFCRHCHHCGCCSYC